MNRTQFLVGLFVLFLVPTLSLAQQHTSFGPDEKNATIKNTASLTTTDLLSAQDFAPKMSEVPAQRSRWVGTGKKNKKGELIPASGNENKLSVSTGMKSVDAANNLMTTVEKPRAPEVPLSAPSSTGDVRLDSLITAAAARNGLDHRLILAVIKQESSFHPNATSNKGARGLMQLMPATAMRFGVRDIYDPAQNIEGGAKYLRFLLDTFNGDVELALAGYNAGENAVARYGNRIPPYRETQDYVRKISAHYIRLTNGTIVRRSVVGGDVAPKQVEAGTITAGQTMTQF